VSLKVLIYTQILMGVRLIVGFNKHMCFITIVFDSLLPAESEYNTSLMDGFGTNFTASW
jgi:hypothetical protein